MDTDTDTIDWPDLRFLVIDDEPVIREMIARLLRGLGAEKVDEASNGLDAIAYLTDPERMPDCVIADIKMHPMNGIELLRMIRTDPKIIRHDVPTIFLTGNADAAHVQAARALDASGFIVKPSSIEAMTMHIAQALLRENVVGPQEFYAK